MERFNPETWSPFRRGHLRKDGFIFLGYNRSRVLKDGFYGESWASPEAFNKDTEKKRAYVKTWAKNNPGANTARSKLRETNKKHRTPPWITKDQKKEIDSIYRRAKSLTEKTGVAYHVDHIIPLQGKLVSGLHVPENLQILPASLNISKSNYFEV